MKTKTFACLWTLVLLLVTAAVPIRPASAALTPEQPVPNSDPAGHFSPPVVYLASPKVSDFTLPVPETVTQRMSANLAQTAPFVVDYVPAGQKDAAGYYTCSTFPTNAQASVNHAINIWSHLLYGSANAPIHVQACWTYIANSSYLGFSYSDLRIDTFPNIPAGNYVYSMAEANSLAGQDLNGSLPEIVVILNGNYQFDLNTNGTSDPTKHNLATVVLHEVGHGLGFAGSLAAGPQNGPYTYAYWGYDLQPAKANIFDRYPYEGWTQLMLIVSFVNYSSRMLSAVTGGDLWFGGPAAVAANGYGEIKLWAPSPWNPASSYAHLDEWAFDQTENALMTPSLDQGEVLYSPGPITLGLFADIGWPFPPDELTLNNTSISENQPIGTTVGTLSANDPNTLPEIETNFTYALAPGGVDNAYFKVESNALKTNAILNHEAKSSYAIRLRVTDSTGLYFDKDFTITTTNVNEPPSGMLTGRFVVAGTPAGQLVAVLIAKDPDAGAIHTFQIKQVGSDYTVFNIESGNRLVTTQPIVKSVGESYSITLIITDGSDQFEYPLRVQVIGPLDNALFFSLASR